MIRINNAVSRAPRLTLESIVIKNTSRGRVTVRPVPEDEEETFRSGDIPQVSDAYEKEAGKVWDKYFEWLFTEIGSPSGLVKRIKTKFSTPNSEQCPIAEVLTNDRGVKIRGLLEILLARPDELDKKIGGFTLRELGVRPPADEARRAKKTGVDEPEGEREKKTRKRDALEASFDYEAFSGKHDERATDLRSVIELLGVRVCPYCGRAFTGAVRRKSGKLIRTDQLDHFLPKSKYPQLALSLWNLIPSCGACNNRKSDDCEDEILYPYAEEMGDACRFVTHPVSGFGYLLGEPSEGDFEISLEAEDEESDLAKKAKAEAELFGTKELYQQHKAYVRDIFRQRYVFGDPYIDDLITTFPRLFRSREQVRALLYMKKIDPGSIGTEPLDKLTRDIDLEIDELEKRY